MPYSNVYANAQILHKVWYYYHTSPILRCSRHWYFKPHWYWDRYQDFKLLFSSLFVFSFPILIWLVWHLSYSSNQGHFWSHDDRSLVKYHGQSVRFLFFPVFQCAIYLSKLQRGSYESYASLSYFIGNKFSPSAASCLSP